MEKRRSIFKIIWFFFQPYKLPVMALIGLSLLVGALEAATIAAVYPILSVVFDSGSTQGNVVLSLLRTIGNLLPIDDEFIAYCVLFLLLALLAFVVKLISANFKVKFGANLVARNQTEIFNKFIGADYQYFIDHKQGELIYSATTAPEQLSTLIFAVTELISQAILAILVILLLFSLFWPGAVAVLLVGLGYDYFTRYLGKRVSYYSGKGEVEALSESNVILNEAISGIKQVKVFVTGENWTDRFSSTMKKRWHHYRRRSVWQQIPPAVLMLILYLSIGTTALLIKMISPVSFTEVIPILGSFAFAIFRLAPIIGIISGLTMGIMGTLPHCEVVYSIRSEKSTHIQDGEKELRSLQSGIQLDDVSFAYKGRAGTLKNVSVTFEKGKTTAIIGRSGTGKTTLVNLLLRLFDVDQGEIRIDGVNIKEYKLSSWLNKIGFVSQDTFIFNDTIRNNITFRSEKYSDEEVIKAARYAEAHNFITELPQGYDTLVGDKGMRLSGGQAQRIAVTRAMIRQPEILIFDEATNALDSVSEEAIQRAINEISRDHTVIIIAHRLSTVVNADKIIVLEKGRVVEEGTQKELVARRGTYWELYRSQPV